MVYRISVVCLLAIRRKCYDGKLDFRLFVLLCFSPPEMSFIVSCLQFVMAIYGLPVRYSFFPQKSRTQERR